MFWNPCFTGFRLEMVDFFDLFLDYFLKIGTFGGNCFLGQNKKTGMYESCNEAKAEFISIQNLFSD